MRDIAKRANVHFTTVGLALRRDPRVTVETADRIRAIATELGYTHDAMLSALSSYRHRNAKRHAGVIGCIVTYSPEQGRHNVTERQFIDGATRCARAQGFEIESFQINAPGMTAARLSRLLRARGIQGLILSPKLPLPGPMPDLDWQHFSTVAVGYSITNLRIHRVCVHHAYNIRLAMQQLRSRGYRRIGLVLPYEIFERSLGIVPGTFLSEQFLLPESDRVTPLIEHKTTKASLDRWLRGQRIDCVILSAYWPQMLAWIKELGHRVPQDIGVCLGQLFGLSTDLAGIDNQTDLLGEAAASFVISMLKHNERGLPVYPRSISVEGRWVEQATVRPPA
jgi:LacI family transcriptional regulator